MTWRCEYRYAHDGSEWNRAALPRNSVESAKRDAKETHRIALQQGRKLAYRIVDSAGEVWATCEPTGGWRLRWRWATEGAL